MRAGLATDASREARKGAARSSQQRRAPRNALAQGCPQRTRSREKLPRGGQSATPGRPFGTPPCTTAERRNHARVPLNLFVAFRPMSSRSAWHLPVQGTFVRSTINEENLEEMRPRVRHTCI